MRMVVFEDATWSNLAPIAYLRPVFELRCGFFSLYDRLMSVLPCKEKGLWVRDYLVNLAKAKYGLPVNDPSFFTGDLFLVNGTWLIKHGTVVDMHAEGAVTCGGNLVRAVVKEATAQRLWKGDFNAFLAGLPAAIPTHESAEMMMSYPWNFIQQNPALITEDFAAAGNSGIAGTMAKEAVVFGDPKAVYIAPGAEVHPLVVLDTKGGPVYVDKKARIYPNTRIEGPCYVGEETYIMSGANIREGSNFGPVCRIGGEVEESIFHSYANKYHDGFIGHAYVGEFVNLGALTTNSDLKNDYSTVSVYLNGKPFDTGDLKVGSFFGDHTKTSIGTLFNTGTIVGAMCNVTAGGILPKFFPSFTWYINNKFMKGYGLEMMIKTARAAMERRKRTMTKEEEEVIRAAHELTAGPRLAAVRKSRKG